jgi:hypothetical protein
VSGLLERMLYMSSTDCVLHNSAVAAVMASWAGVFRAIQIARGERAR